MNPTSALVAFILLAITASLHVPGCLPDEDATIVSEAMFPVPELDNPIPRLENLTITHFTCPSRQAQTQTESPELRGLQSGIHMAGDTHNSTATSQPDMSQSSVIVISSIGRCGTVSFALSLSPL
jgi:hypothetical protein